MYLHQCLRVYVWTERLQNSENQNLEEKTSKKDRRVNLSMKWNLKNHKHRTEKYRMNKLSKRKIVEKQNIENYTYGIVLLDNRLAQKFSELSSYCKSETYSFHHCVERLFLGWYTAFGLIPSLPS